MAAMSKEQPASNDTPKAYCPDCSGQGTRIEARAYLPHRSKFMSQRFVPVSCRSCKGRGHFRI